MNRRFPTPRALVSGTSSSRSSDGTSAQRFIPLEPPGSRWTLERRPPFGFEGERAASRGRDAARLETRPHSSIRRGTRVGSDRAASSDRRPRRVPKDRFDRVAAASGYNPPPWLESASSSRFGAAGPRTPPSPGACAAGPRPGVLYGRDEPGRDRGRASASCARR